MSLLFERRAVAHPMPADSEWGTSPVPGYLLPASDPDRVQRLVPLFAAQRLIADQFAACTLHGYRARPDGTRERLADQPKLLTSPSPHRSLVAWKFELITSLLMHGNAYGLITSTDAAGWPQSIEWLSPQECAVDESKRQRPYYFFRGKEINPASVVHIPWFVRPGKWAGLSPLECFQVAFEAGDYAQGTSRDWFRNGAVPSGHLRNTAKTLKADEATTAKSRFKASIAGRDVFVTGNDWEYASIGVTADQAHFIDQLRLTATQIASIYGIPPEMVGGETGSSLTYATVEQNLLNFATLTLRPWFERVEEHLSRLLPNRQYAKFNIDGVVRADIKTRMESHEIGLRTGVETLAEARALEDRPPLTDEQKADWLANRGVTQ